MEISVLAQSTTDQTGPDLSLADLLDLEIIVASKSKEKLQDAPGIISVVTRDELERFGGTTLKDALDRVPGLISTTINFSDRTAIAFRGDQLRNTSGHVLLLVNGRPIREVQEGGISSEMFNTFPLDIIERIEVIKGPGSVLYGSDAFSGVINIVTQKALKNGISITGIGGDGGAYGSSASATAVVGDLSIAASGRYLKKADWQPTYTGYYSSAFDTVEKDSVINPLIPDEGAGAFLDVNYKGLRLMGGYNEWHNRAIGINGFSGKLFGDTEWRKWYVNAGYDYELNDAWRVALNATHVRTDMFNVDQFTRASYNVIGELTNFITLSDKSKLVAGGLFTRIRGEEHFIPLGGLKNVDGEQNNYALYAQVDYHILKNLACMGGVQGNKVKDLPLNMVPRAGLIWSPLSNVSVKALYSEAFKAAGVMELSMDFSGFQGNPDLKPEKTKTVEVGVNVSGDTYQLGINGFWSRHTELILVDIISTTYREFANMGDATFMGGEFEGMFYLTKKLYLKCSLSYQTSKSDTEKNISPIADFGAKAGVSYAWDRGITVSLFDLFQGEPDRKFADPYTPDKLSYNLLNLHTDVNLNRLFDFQAKTVFTLALDVDNLLDREYYLYSTNSPVDTPIPATRGRALYASLNVSR